jgi:hypothetical protein
VLLWGFSCPSHRRSPHALRPLPDGAATHSPCVVPRPVPHVQKFLLDKNGVPVSRWTSDADPVIMSDAIKAVLAA